VCACESRCAHGFEHDWQKSDSH